MSFFCLYLQKISIMDFNLSKKVKELCRERGMQLRDLAEKIVREHTSRLSCWLYFL